MNTVHDVTTKHKKSLINGKLLPWYALLQLPVNDAYTSICECILNS